ncbi:starch phosphorylase [Inhella inkyongensis]|uniref:Alpha-1,4 glucan phosphorylase n=1 Tax=Inhella inkyongensis TaxID=392593 RepID=A0A840S982_9BURK|nr:glycogen/starch/alpha-glucan phosphorylase [Inhella inkyongensis]MBB5206172.1 starch phosphorylase [Inhella inkyongensis]
MSSTSSSIPRSQAALQKAFQAALAREMAQAQAQQLPLDAQAVLRAAALACRDVLAARWAQVQMADAARRLGQGVRRVHYLSMEFLMGRALHNALSALGLRDCLEQALAPLGLALGDVLEREPDAALGNGGLGRLAACFLDSFAELGLPSFGYGLRYEYGMFAQGIADGRQIERPDDWMRAGNPWEVVRPELRYLVRFGGRVVVEGGQRRWVGGEEVEALAFDFIVPAHHSARVSTLRQWQARSVNPIAFDAFCRGEHAQANQHRVAAEALNWVLYPDDSTEAGQMLRLKQEALLVSASLQDLIARHLREAGGLQGLGRANAIHLNDTHPALAPAELMRLLLDEHGLGWEEAWNLTRQAVSYTNHTLMPEALETWPLRMFEALLPRHLEIIYEINHRFLEGVRRQHPGDDALLRRVSLIDEGPGDFHSRGGERRVRMAALAVVASHRVNGVAQLHSDLCVQTIFADYARLFPDRFHNVTNGVTPRRWLAQANPALSSLLDETLGEGWRTDLSELKKLAKKAGQLKLQKAFQQVKRANKEKLAARIRMETGLVVSPDSLFDVQIKRIHEYKRQLLNILHVIARYQAIVANPAAAPDGMPWVPRTVVIAGKAASAYQMAKLIIQLAHDVGRVVNSDPRVGDKLKLVFLPNYGVSLAETIIPAADLSEQISTAGTEASGTGNMKFAMNGALTIGTWDGANIEMAEHMGVDEMFVFGLRTEGVAKIKALGYDPRLYIEESRALKAVMDAIGDGSFSGGDANRYRALLDNLQQRDGYLLMADFADYCATQARVDELFRDPAGWSQRAIKNVAGMGWFSSDRTIAEYVERVWSVESLG